MDVIKRRSELLVRSLIAVGWGEFMKPNIPYRLANQSLLLGVASLDLTYTTLLFADIGQKFNLLIRPPILKNSEFRIRSSKVENKENLEFRVQSLEKEKKAGFEIWNSESTPKSIPTSEFHIPNSA